tara:strand:+ start:248 stop:1021 length:774 start_codon:yes stop_codon:yes gene_type:complete
MRTPIKDPGPSFSSTLTHLKKTIPENSEVSTFLFYGGNLELNLAESGRNVTSFTNNYVIYEFWKYLMEDSFRIAEIVKFMHRRAEDDKKMFLHFQKEWTSYRDPFMRAAMFFLLNRCSTTGYVSSGDFYPEGVNELSISYLVNCEPVNFDINWFTSDDFIASLNEDNVPGEYLLIPAGKFSYNFFEEGKNKGVEETTVDHRLLNQKFKNFKKRCTLIYKYHPVAAKLYKDFNVVMADKFGRPTEESSRCEDLIIANF